MIDYMNSIFFHLGNFERRKWQPTPVFLSGKSHGQRSLAGYSPWGFKESDMIEQLSTKAHCHSPLYVVQILPEIY